MEVFQRCQQEAFRSSCCFSEELIVENDEYSMAEVLQKLFSDVHSSATSTPITTRMSEIRGLNDSGFNDSFSSDLAVSEMSSLYLNDLASEYNEHDELFYPKMCLLSKLEDNCDENCLINGLEHPTISDISDCCELKKELPVCEVNLSVPLEECGVLLSSQNEIRERTSSARRFRSPAPVVVRYSRHRLSLDSYTESPSKECDNRQLSSESVVSLVPIDAYTDSNAWLPSNPYCCDSVETLVQQTLAKFAPPCLDHLIGRRMGMDAVDIVSELFARSMHVIIGKILNYVSASDLCRICMVNRRWREAADSNRVSICRKESFIASQRSLSSTSQEQNIVEISKSHQKSSAVRSRSLTAEPLSEVRGLQCCEDLDLTVSEQPATLAQRFWQEVMKLRQDERLTKCPRCTGPSRTDIVQERATCVKLACQYDFCTRCMSSFHGSLRCPSALPRSRRSEPCVGSRQSHRNLRRL